MNKLLVALSIAALVWLLTAAVLCLTGTFDLDRTKLHLLAATVLWFVTAPWWMAKDRA